MQKVQKVLWKVQLDTTSMTYRVALDGKRDFDGTHTHTSLVSELRFRRLFFREISALLLSPPRIPLCVQYALSESHTGCDVTSKQKQSRYC